MEVIVLLSNVLSGCMAVVLLLCNILLRYESKNFSY